MFKRLWSGLFCLLPYLKLLIAVLVMSPIMVIPLNSTSAQPLSSAIAFSSSESATTVPAAAQANSVATQQDPLGSPHPVPWDWVMTTQATFSPSAGLH